MFERFLEILSFFSKITYPKFTVLHHFWALFNPGKSKILAKTKISSKYTSSGLPNKISSRTYKNHRILIKLIKNGLNYPLALAQRVNTNSHIGYYKTIYPYFLDP